ncbi:MULTISPECIES: glycosyltransferase family 4 protein [unclassified Photorhabdus]|uniref:glycosyltransferase family 4 protein n=1 Tax=unclassified Photorhabdus TaxID=2620880 RepID=UPI000DCDE09A|nr:MULTISPECIES: glycosyltransferase family 4 protein [unclassified Photorhabdus]RAX01872.1 hypothetical protein CKY03_05530 [Photorhabdus sp. S9-53]RAX02368.1 hypothetical protein CKY05_04115 [Photorhabdus sp. S10-54]RAX05407.1 hypothetical protein CKY04_04110 [Photorhabdus sp. S8-52]
MNKKLMTIFILSREYPPFTIGGTSIVACSLAEGISSSCNVKVGVITNTTKEINSYEIYDNLHIYRVANEEIYTNHSNLSDTIIRSHHRLLKGANYLVSKLGVPDIILLPDLFCFPEARIMSKLYNCPIVNILSQDFRKITLYDKNTFHMVSNATSASHNSLFDLEEKSLRMSDYNVFVSNSISNSINESYNLESNNQSVVYLGITFEEMAPLTVEEYVKKRKKVASAQEILIVACGRLVPVKGMNYLIEAVYLLKQKVSNIRLLIIGIGPELLYLQELVHQFKLDEQVIFLGDIPRKDTLVYFKIADIAVVPSIWESFCYVAAEFMGIGKPIVCTSVDSLNELVRDGIDGIKIPVYLKDGKRILDPEDIFRGILRFIEEPDLARKMAKSARERVLKNFNNTFFVNGIMDVCNKLLSKRKI